MGLVAGLVALIALWLTFQHKPGWYRPATLDEAGIQQARSQAVATADFVGDQMVRGEPFDVVLLDRSVGEWLAALPHVWPDARDSLPPEFSDLAVRFDEGKVQIGAHYAARQWQAIVSVDVLLRPSDDGSAIEIALSSAHSGSLPVPRAILKGLLDHLLQSPWATRRVARSSASLAVAYPRTKARHSTAGPRHPAALQEVQSVDELFEGVRIRNRFVWFNGDRPFRIDSIRIDGGELRLRIDPLQR